MNAANQNSPQEVAVLTKSIEFVVRNFLKILVGKISLVRLQQLVQSVFIEEAENYLQKERPGKSCPMIVSSAGRSFMPRISRQGRPNCDAISRTASATRGRQQAVSESHGNRRRE